MPKDSVSVSMQRLSFALDLKSDLNILNIIEGADLSLSVYNESYKQSYHSKSLGAYTESMIKHILPSALFIESSLFIEYPQSHKSLESFSLYSAESLESFPQDSKPKDFKLSCHISKLIDYINNIKNISIFNNFKSNQKVKILDICFGLGYNAMLALKHFSHAEIYSPEKDFILEKLLTFKYKNIEDSNKIISLLIKNKVFMDKNKILYFLHGDVLDFLESFGNEFFDIAFQDPFSQEHNAELWSLPYFQQLYRIMKKDSIITTYAKAKNILVSAKKAGFIAIKHRYGSVFLKI